MRNRCEAGLASIPSRKTGRQIVLESLLVDSSPATIPNVLSFYTVKEGIMRQVAGFKPATDTASNTENGTVVVVLLGRAGTNQDRSRRQYLTETEVTQLCDAARARGRWGIGTRP